MIWIVVGAIPLLILVGWLALNDYIAVAVVLQTIAISVTVAASVSAICYGLAQIGVWR